MVELKPCPFCGGRVYPIYHSGTKKYYLQHYENDRQSCLIETVELVGFGKIESIMDAYNAWNRRADNG